MIFYYITACARIQHFPAFYSAKEWRAAFRGALWHSGRLQKSGVHAFSSFHVHFQFDA
jgi:hypothetical protein